MLVGFGSESISGRAIVCKRIFAKRLRDARLFAYGAAVRHFVLRWIVTTIAVMVASALPGIRYDRLGSLIGAALLLGILNAFVRPGLLFLSAPLILLSLGLSILVIGSDGRVHILTHAQINRVPGRVIGPNEARLQ